MQKNTKILKKKRRKSFGLRQANTCQVTKEKINNWTSSKLKAFSLQNTLLRKLKDQPQIGQLFYSYI